MRSGPLPTKPTSLYTRVQTLQVSIAAVIVLLGQNVPIPTVEAAPERPRLVTTMARVYPVEVTIATPTPRPAQRVRAAPAPARMDSGACGGDLPSCSIVQCESKGNIRARNSRSSAAGKYQFLSSTWNGYGGYSSADQAPEEVQDAKARELWAGGAGRSHWAQCL